MLVMQILLAGLLGAVLMTGVMSMIHRSGWANADMIRAVGSLVTRSMEGAAKVGAIVHLLAGVAFASLYVAVLSLVLDTPSFLTAPLGAVLGLVHGIVVGYVILAGVSKHHPVPQFRDAGVPVAAAHVIGHVAYGFGVGTMVSVLGIHWSPLG